MRRDTPRRVAETNTLVMAWHAPASLTQQASINCVACSASRLYFSRREGYYSIREGISSYIPFPSESDARSRPAARRSHRRSLGVVEAEKEGGFSFFVGAGYGSTTQPESAHVVRRPSKKNAPFGIRDGACEGTWPSEGRTLNKEISGGASNSYRLLQATTGHCKVGCHPPTHACEVLQ